MKRVIASEERARNKRLRLNLDENNRKLRKEKVVDSKENLSQNS